DDGSMANDTTTGKIPSFFGVQVAPPSGLRKTPPNATPAHAIEGSVGSSASAWPFRGAFSPLSRAHVAPSSTVLKTPFETPGPVYRVPAAVGSTAIALMPLPDASTVVGGVHVSPPSALDAMLLRNVPAYTLPRWAGSTASAVTTVPTRPAFD